MTLQEIVRRGFITDGLAGFWHAGNYDGEKNYITNNPFPNELTDITGNGNNITFNNFSGTTSSGANGDNTELTPCYIQSDGVNDFAKTSGTTNMSSTVFSVQFNFSKANADSWVRFLRKYNANYKGLQLSLESTSKFWIQLSGFSSIQWSLDDNKIYNIGITCNGNTLKTYRNGELINTANGAIEGIGGDLTLFAQDETGYKAASASLYNISYYDDKVLSLSEIQQNYNVGLIWASIPSNLICSFKTLKYQNNALLIEKINNNRSNCSKFTNSFLEVLD